MSAESKPIVQRLYSRDIQALLKPLKPTGPVPKLPPIFFNSFKQIESLLSAYHDKPNSISINHVATLGLPSETITSLTLKMFELVDMLNNADDDSYPHHVSIGSIHNVGMSVLRRCFYVAIERAKQLEQQPGSNITLSRNNRTKHVFPNEYPFVQVSKPHILRYLSSLFLRIYKFNLTQQLFPLYAASCLQLCCYTPYCTFNVSTPQDIYWQSIYDAVFDLISSSSIPMPEDHRYWLNEDETK